MKSRMNRQRLNIGAFVLQPYARSERHVEDIAKCGIDFITWLDMGEGADPAFLDYFQKYNVGAIVSGIVPRWWGMDGQNAGKLAEMNPLEHYITAAKAFRDHPAIWGIDVGDEPSALDFPYYGEVVRCVRKNFPNQFPYLNLYPNYASVAQNNAQQTINQLGTTTYQEHIDLYCENVDTDYISYDHYLYSASVAGHYENLQIVADACRKTGRSLWIVLQINSNKPDKWISENQLRAQAFSSLAFGAEVILWGCYTAGWWQNQVLDGSGNKTEQYEKLRNVNASLHALDGDYMRFRNTSTHFVGFAEGSADLGRLPDVVAKESLNTGVFRDVKSATKSPLVIGEMTSRADDGARALMIFAADDPLDVNNQPVDVTFRCPGRRVKAVGADLRQDVQDDSFTLKLRSCGGALVVAEGWI